MKKILYLILLILNTTAASVGQDIQYPARQLMESGNYAQAENIIMQALDADSSDCASLFAAYKLYSASDNGSYNYERAYEYLLSSKTAYNKTRDKARLIKMHLTMPNINKAIIDHTQIALDKASKSNTRKAYQDFLDKYRLASHTQITFAKNRIQIFDFRENYHEDWDYLKACIQSLQDNPELMTEIQDSIFQLSKRDPRIDMIRYCYNNMKSQEMRDSCVLLMHRVYESCGVWNFSDFWKTYFSAALRSLKERDEAIAQTYRSGDKFRIVIDAAPYNCAYQAFWDLISGRLKASDWEGALHKMRSFQDYFDDSRDFQSLRKTIMKKEDESITITPIKAAPASAGMLPETIHKNKYTIPMLMPGQTHPTFSSDGNVVIFSAKAKTSYELQPSENLFVAIKGDNGKWGKPFEIGNQVNTPFRDCSPFLHTDNTTLYFCSEGHGSLGQCDIYMTTRLSSDSWTDWSEPVNLGKQINTNANEADFALSPDGSTGHMTSNLSGQYKVYSISMPIERATKNSTVVSGVVTDNKGAIVITQIIWEDLETQQVIGQTQTGGDGRYTMTLADGKNYGYYISNSGYFPSSSNIDLRGKNLPARITNNIQVTPLSEMIGSGKPIVMRNLFFNSGNYKLLPASQSELQRVYNVIKDKDLSIEISGYTDNTGDDIANQVLSENRAKAVKEYLVKLGYPADKLSTIGHGRHKPIATNTTPTGRKQNRRVELRVVR